MSIETKPSLFAVGALMVCQDKFVVVTEANTSRKSVKIAGQQTFPMETVESIDRDDLATLIRACSEEVDYNLSNPLATRLLCIIETRPGVELRNYLLEVPNENLVGRGSFVDEVSSINWIQLEEVVKSKGQLRFRPGVYETVASYRQYRINPGLFRPNYYSHTQLVDQIPQQVYELVEQGISGTEAVSQWLAR